MSFPKHLEKKLKERIHKNTLRALPGVPSGVDFSSNDYLGFASNKRLQEKVHNYLSVHDYNNGATGSRLLTGNHALYEEVETLIATFHNTASALVFNSGYDANIGFFSSVPQHGDVILYDAFIHASIRDGIVMSKAKAYKFSHNNLKSLAEKLSALALTTSKDTAVYVVTEAVFSMDGDSPDLTALATLCEQYGALLVVDEAHALGVCGKEGKGVVYELGLTSAVFASIVTFGKGLGTHGAAILGSTQLKSYLLNFARSLIYTTGLPPHSLASIKFGYEALATTEATGKLLENINTFTSLVHELNMSSSFVSSSSAIQCCIIPGNAQVKNVARALQAQGFDVRPIMYPTVPEGSERLRFCLHSFNSPTEIAAVLKLLATFVTS